MKARFRSPLRALPPTAWSGMTGDLMYAFEKCAGQVTNLMIGEWAIADRMPRIRVTPFPVWREDRDEAL